MSDRLSAEHLQAPFPWFGGKDARAWAIEAGKNKLMRISIAGYDGEHVMPDDWAVVEWKAHGGYGNLNSDDDGVGRVNSRRERLWFSPACIKPYRDRTLLDLMGAE